MLWSNVRTWAKKYGYHTSRTKLDPEGEDNQYRYDWYKIDDPSIYGQTTSAGKLATAIYNHMTDNKYIEYQEKYKLEQSNKDIFHNDIKG